jgi:hypothetical protein
VDFDVAMSTPLLPLHQHRRPASSASPSSSLSHAHYLFDEMPKLLVAAVLLPPHHRLLPLAVSQLEASCLDELEALEPMEGLAFEPMEGETLCIVVVHACSALRRRATAIACVPTIESSLMLSTTSRCK